MKIRRLPSALRRKGFWGSLRFLYYKVIIQFMCAVESVGGAAVVPWLMAPFAVLDFTIRRRDYPQFVRLHDALPDTFWNGLGPKQHYWKMIRDWQEGLGTILFYHRLGLPYWQKRFRVVGTPPQLLAEWGSRPVILAFLHTGQFGLIRFWLRSQGVPTASMVKGMPHQVEILQAILDRGDVRYGLEGVPQIFSGSKSIREAIRFLVPGHALTMAMDGGGSSSKVDGHYAGDFPIQVQEGACRIAAQTNARVIPVSVKRTAACRFDIRFGEPVPDALIQKDDFCGATQHLISELWKDLKHDPGELNWTTLEALAPDLKAKRIWWP
jgi:lauroyl/myristoyl acyltransferase